jgi:biotin operon repressor
VSILAKTSDVVNSSHPQTLVRSPGRCEAPPTPALQTALHLEALGLAVIPLHAGTKRPVWLAWQRKRARADRILEHTSEHPDANWGLVTGQVSGVLVLDVDGEAGRESLRGKHLPPTPTANTPSGGCHYYYRLPPGKTWGGKVRLLPGLDVRCEGNFVVAPGSQREDGAAWSWAIPLEHREDLADPPAWLCDLLDEDPHQTAPRSAQKRPGAGAGEKVDVLPGELPAGVQAGARNDTAARVIGRWLHLGLSAEQVWARVPAWDKQNMPPLLQDWEEARKLEDLVQRLCAKEAAKDHLAGGLRIPRTLLRRGLGDGPLLLAGQMLAHYQQGGRPPAWAELAASLGVDRSTVWRWRQALEQAGVTEEVLAVRPRQRYFTLPAAVLFDLAATRAERVTALCVASFMEDGQAAVGLELLARVRGLSSRQVRRHLRALEATGYLVTSRSEYDPALGKRRRVNVYTWRSDVARVSGSMKAGVCIPLAVPLNPPVGTGRAPIRATLTPKRAGHAPSSPPGGPKETVRGAYKEAERVLHDKPHEYGPTGRDCCTGVRREELPERVNLPAAILRVIPYNLALEYLTERGYTESDLLAFCALFEEGGGNSE